MTRHDWGQLVVDCEVAADDAVDCLLSCVAQRNSGDGIGIGFSNVVADQWESLCTVSTREDLKIILKFSTTRNVIS